MRPEDGVAAAWSGRSIPRFEDPALVRGRGRFTADLASPLWVRFVRSPVAAGVITSIVAPPGVRMFTGADLDAVRPIRPMLHKFGYVPISQAVMAQGVVRYVGEPLAVVVATTEAVAEDGAEEVLVEIDPTEAVADAAAALSPGAPEVHPGVARNTVVRTEFATPGHAAACIGPLRISASIRSGRQNATPIETRAAHAAFDAGTGRVTLTCTTQMPHLARTAIADLLAMPEADLRVIAPDVGGGFGQKMSLAPEYVVLVWLARRLQSTVAWAEDRRDNLMASFHARDMTVSVDGYFDAAARLVALTGDVVVNVGAYAPFPNTAAVEPLMSLAELPGPYAVAEYACTATGVVTNTCPTGPYRGVARPAITLAMEQLMDRAAAAFGLERAEIRRRNLVRQFPFTSATGLVYDDASYVETMEAAVAAADFPGFRARQAAALAAGQYLGIGMATFCERTGYGTPAFAARGMEVTPGWEVVELAMDPSGFVTARIGASPHGQGLRTTLAQIIADALGITPDCVRIVHGDTDATPYGWGTFASRALVISGGASLLAARKLAATLSGLAAHVLEASAADIVLADGHAAVAGTDRRIALPALARMAHHGTHNFGIGSGVAGLSETARYDPGGTFSNACHIAEVAFDRETCGVRVVRFIVAEDAGRLINPMIVDGQIQGGVAQGIANALLEEIVYDEMGTILTTSLADYLPPTSGEIPAIEIIHRQTLTGDTLTQAKGVGEGGTIGAPAAVLAAINDALAPFGATIDTMPATPQRLYDALTAQATLSTKAAP